MVHIFNSIFYRVFCFFLHRAIITVAIVISVAYTLMTVNSNDNRASDTNIDNVSPDVILNSTELFTLMVALPWPIKGKSTKL